MQRLKAACLGLLLILPIITAQAQTEIKKNNPDDALTVTASASVERVRFTAGPSAVQIGLEVFDAKGVRIINHDLRDGNLLDWQMRDLQANRVPDEIYLCLVTLKSLSGKIIKTMGTLTLTTDTARIQPVVRSSLTQPQAEAIGPVAEEASLTVLDNEPNQTTSLLAHDGTDGQITRGHGALSFRVGDFYAGKDNEQMRLTAEGNLGIGITNPEAKLDVNGMIRATQGLVFPDGSIQYSASRKTFGAASLGPGQFQQKGTPGQEHLSPDTSGTGTTAKIPKWLDGPAGVLNDSNITDLNGAIGINAPPSTNFRLDVNGSTRIRGSNPGFNLEGLRAAGNLWVFQTVDDDGRFRLFSQDNVNPGVERLTIKLDTGNIGIGTSAPAGLLHVKGANPVRILGETSTLSGSESVDFFARNSPFNSDLGGMRIQRQAATGNIDTLFFAAASGNAATEMMRVRGDGRVGIGTTTPGFPLTFANTLGDKISLWGQSGNHYGFGIQSNLLQIHADSSSSDIAFGQGSSAAFTEAMRIKGNGNVGIGTTAPTARLGVLGSGTAVYGEGSVGVHGFSPGGLGVRGVSPDGFGVRGDSTTGHGVVGFSTNGDGVQGNGANGVHGTSGSGNGVLGESPDGNGVKGTSSNNFGIAGYTTNGTGVYGDNGNSNTTGHAGYFNGRVNITGNLYANNLAGGKFSQQHTGTGNSIPFGGAIVDTFTITAPDRGVLFISAFVNLVTATGGYMQHDFALEEGAGTVLTQTTEEGANGGNRLQRTAHLSWMLRVDAGQSVTIRSVIRVGLDGWVSTKYYDHNLSVIYLRSEY